MVGTERPALENLNSDDLNSRNEINRRAVLAAAGVGIAAGAASLLAACGKHGEPSASSTSPTSEAPKPGQLDLEIPRSAFGNGEGTYTVLLCADTLISNAGFNAIPDKDALPQRIVFDGGQHYLIVRPHWRGMDPPAATPGSRPLRNRLGHGVGPG